MYLSSRDIKWVIDCQKLIVNPRPEDIGCGYDETSIDLHLGSLSEARIWDLSALKEHESEQGVSEDEDAPVIHVGTFDWKKFGPKYEKPVPDGDQNPDLRKKQLVYRDGPKVVVKRFGFLLWTTREIVGTPKIDPNDISATPKRHPELICFVNGKSTRARTGLLVHFTAPTIHAGWDGKVTLEIANLGPFTFVLKENDAIAQLTAATISSAPDLTLKKERSRTQGQRDPSGLPPST